MEWAIRVRDLAKQYSLGAGHNGEYRTLREAIVQGLSAPLRLLRRSASSPASAKSSSKILWALRNICFEVRPGEVVGIIGRNGAGKSTLLKILSRITEPSEGRAEIRGRLGSLLEVGTGFHSELTGRENIYLNGSILGMTRREIERKFEEIVAFSEVEEFLDLPVKRYSSGMYVRLAFAVAAHLEPEILIVDEVLAVGDAEFQRKCLGKMRTVADAGRTVLFVSHNMNVVQRLCNRVLLLDRGRSIAYGPTTEVVARYLAEQSDLAPPGLWIDLHHASRSGTRGALFTGLRYTSKHTDAANRPYPDGRLEIRLRIEARAPRCVNSLAVTFHDRYETRLVNADIVALGKPLYLKEGPNQLALEIEALHLNPGMYSVGLRMVTSGEILDCVPSAIQLEVVDIESGSLGKRPDQDGVVPCRFRLLDEVI